MKFSFRSSLDASTSLPTSKGSSVRATALDFVLTYLCPSTVLRADIEFEFESERMRGPLSCTLCRCRMLVSLHGVTSFPTSSSSSLYVQSSSLLSSGGV